MNLAFIYDVTYPEVHGGVEKRIADLSSRLAKKGHNIHLYSMKCWDGPDSIFRDGYYIHGICRPFRIYNYKRRSIFQSMFYAASLFFPLLKCDFDLIECESFPYFPFFIVKIISFIKKTPVITNWIEIWDDYWYTYLGFFGVFGKCIEKLVIFLSDENISISSHVSNRLKKFNKCARVFPIGIDITHIRSIKPSSQKSDVIFAGRLIPEKNPDIVIESIYKLSFEYPDIFCIIIGDGPLFQNLTKKVEMKKLKKNILLMPHIDKHDQIISLMKSSRVFLLPSIREGFGIVLIEAIASEIPIITTNHPLNAGMEHVIPGTGVLANPNPNEIICALKGIFNDTPNRKILQKYANKFDYDIIVNNIEHFFFAVKNGYK